MIETIGVGDDPEPISGPDAADGVEDSSSGGRTGLPLELPEQAVQRLEEELAGHRDRHLRLAAEFDNFRKRAAREREEVGLRSQAALVTRLLDVLDDLDRVMSGAAGQGGDVVQQAVLLIDRKLRKELEAGGLERLDPVGQPFDPKVHEAVAVLPAAEGKPDHTVAATFQVGYRFKGALIRPARVQVYSVEGHS